MSDSIVNNQVIVTAQSMNSTFTTGPFNVWNSKGWSAVFEITGSPVGTLKVQVSDRRGNPLGANTPVPASTSWADLDGSPKDISGLTAWGYNFSGSYYNWIRFVYTSTSGSGSTTAYLNVISNSNS